MKQLRDEVGDDDVFDVQSGPIGNSAHLVKEALGDELPLACNDSPDHPLGIEQLETGQLDLQLLGFDVEEEADVFADVVAEQGPLLISHFIRLSLDVKDAVAVHLFKEARAATGEGLGLAPKRRGRRDRHNQE